jgi:hypothetical protein
MNTCSRVSALALAALVLGACAERRAPTEPEGRREEVSVTAPATLAQSASGDPTAIPFGTPTRIEFLGSVRTSRQTLTPPLGAPPAGIDAWLEATRLGVARDRKAYANGRTDAHTVQLLELAERFLGVRTPEELRAALGPVRDSVQETRSTRPLAVGRAAHTATYRVGNREVLRVTTHLRLADVRASLDCMNDPIAIEDGSCSDVSSFDPAQIAADVAAMQSGVDAMSADISALEYSSGYLWAPGECEAERTAFIAAIIAYAWWSAETMVYAWRRDVVNTYRSLRTAIMTYGGVQYAYTKYRDCLRTRTTRTRL